MAQFTIIAGLATLLLIGTAYGGQVCTTHWKRHGCSANAGPMSNNCRVPNVDNIVKATVHQLATVGTGQSQCNEAAYPLASNAQHAFTWNNNYIYLTDNCRAVFNVFYETCVEDPTQNCVRKHKRHGCAANANVQSNQCRVPNVDNIQYATVHNAVAGHVCNPASYPLDASATESYAWNGQYIYMDDDCRAVFDVYYDDCETVVGTCDVKGDPHITTFDEYHANFHPDPTCAYTLVSRQSLRITGTFVQCNRPGTSCLNTITITYQGAEYTLGQNYAVTDGSGNPVSLPLVTNKVSISQVGNKLLAETNNGFAVLWNGEKAAKIDAPISEMGHTSGVCGNFDDDASNDDGFVSNPDQFKVDSNCGA